MDHVSTDAKEGPSMRPLPLWRRLGTVQLASDQVLTVPRCLWKGNQMAVLLPRAFSKSQSVSLSSGRYTGWRDLSISDLKTHLSWLPSGQGSLLCSASFPSTCYSLSTFVSPPRQALFGDHVKKPQSLEDTDLSRLYTATSLMQIDDNVMR